MASTGAAIISAQGDTTGSVWAFRQTQIPGGGGGGGVTSVVQGSGITVTSTGPGGTGAVTVAATGGGGAVASVTASGVGITASPTTGAVIVTNTQPASTWSTYAATQAIVPVAGSDLVLSAPGANISATNNINMGGPGGVVFNTGGFLGASGAPCAITAAAGQNLNITANVVGMFANVDMTGKTITNTSTVTLNPGASTISPYLLSSRNYLDINAPVAIGATPGALRILGNTGSITLAENIDITAGGGQNINITGNVIMGGSTISAGPINLNQYTLNGLVNAFWYGGNVIGSVGAGNTDGPTYVVTAVNKLTLASAAGSQFIDLLPTGEINLSKAQNCRLSGTYVQQPVIQYGTATGSGISGTATVTIPTAYTSAILYVVQVTMRDSPTAQLYATPVTANTFTIGWTSAGTGAQNIMWTTFGT